MESNFQLTTSGANSASDQAFVRALCPCSGASVIGSRVISPLEPVGGHKRCCPAKRRVDGQVATRPSKL